MDHDPLAQPTGPDAAPMERLLYEVKKVIVGQDHLLERLIVALLARGHILVEGVPGLAKTMAIRTLAEAIGLVQSSGNPMELAPQNAYVRRLQHQMAERNNLMSRSRGTEPNRRVELLPDEGRAWR